MNKYQTKLLIFLPILNLICGVTIDLYAPALSKIESFYSTTYSLAQNTITITILGFAFGQLISGILSDHYGRRSTTIIALIVYLVATYEIIFLNSVNSLLFGRLLQGIACGTFAVNSRALAVDNFSGHDLQVAITYLSLAWGIGPIIAPFIGGILVTYFVWQSTIYVLFIYAIFLLISTYLLINKPHQSQYTLANYYQATKEMLIDKEFISRTIILGFCYVQGIIFNLTAPFWVTNVFHQSPNVFGQSALFLGVGYFLGNLLNRILLKKVTEIYLVGFGLLIGVSFSIVFSLQNNFLNIYEVATFIAIINFGAGFIFANIMVGNLSKYAKFAGICTALQGRLMLIIGSIISFIVSLIKTPTIHQIAIFYITLTFLQLILYINLKIRKNTNK